LLQSPPELGDLGGGSDGNLDFSDILLSHSEPKAGVYCESNYDAMTPADAERIELFITRWQTSSGNERANYQMFFSELCDALGVVRPDAKGSILNDPYCFDKDLKIYIRAVR
jgi:hypothetical protein